MGLSFLKFLFYILFLLRKTTTKNVLHKVMDEAKAFRNRIRDRCRDFSEIKVSRHRYLA